MRRSLTCRRQPTSPKLTADFARQRSFSVAAEVVENSHVLSSQLLPARRLRRLPEPGNRLYDAWLNTANDVSAAAFLA